MKKSKQENKNRVLSFTKKRIPEVSVSTSEVTRDLFSDVWKNHLDEVKNMATRLQNKNLNKDPELRMDDSKGSIQLSLLKNNE